MRARKASDSDGPRMRSNEVLLISATLSVLLSRRRGSKVRTTCEGFSSSVLRRQTYSNINWRLQVSHWLYSSMIFNRTGQALTQWGRQWGEPKRVRCVSEKRPEARTDNSMCQGVLLEWHWCSSLMEWCHWQTHFAEKEKKTPSY